MSSTFRYKQDMPPPGGYTAIDFKRVPPKAFLTPRVIFGYSLLLTITGWIGSHYGIRRRRHMRLDLNDREISMEPFIVAERDRAFLRQLKQNYDEEVEIMKDVPGWTPGTYFGRRVYNTIPPDYYVEPRAEEYFAHASESYTKKIWHYADYMYHWFV